MRSDGKMYLGRGQVKTAFMSLAAEVEATVFMKLLFEGGEKEKDISKLMLHPLIKKAHKAGLLKPKEKEFLDKFAVLRNFVFHHRNVIAKIKAVPKHWEVFNNFLWIAGDYVATSEAIYKNNPDREKEYMKYLERSEKRLKEILDSL